MRATITRVRPFARLAIAIALVGSSALPIGSIATPLPSAAVIAGTQQKKVFYSGGIFNMASGKGLDVREQSRDDGGNIQVWDFANAPNQQWDVIEVKNGIYSIVSRHSGKALDVQGRSMADGANVQQFTFNNGVNQVWRLQQGRGGVRIVSVATGKCLDVEAANMRENGANVQVWSCSGQPNQTWRLGR